MSGPWWCSPAWGTAAGCWAAYWTPADWWTCKQRCHITITFKTSPFIYRKHTICQKDMAGLFLIFLLKGIQISQVKCKRLLCAVVHPLMSWSTLNPTIRVLLLRTLQYILVINQVVIRGRQHTDILAENVGWRYDLFNYASGKKTFPTALKGKTCLSDMFPTGPCAWLESSVPGGFLISNKGGRGSQGTAQVLADIDLLCGGRAVGRLLSGGHFYRLPLTLHR